MRKILTPSRRIHLLILLAFAGLTLLMTWPVAARMSTHFAGGRDDLWVHQWTFWWIRQALRDGLNPFYTTYLYHPAGVSLTSHNIAWFNILLWLPLQSIFGHIAGYNLVFLTTVTLNGFFMYLFAYTVTGSRMGAFLAGLIFGFWPYTLSHYDHANMIVLFWVPLSLLLIHRLLESDPGQFGGMQWVWIIGAGVSIAMIGITRWQLLIMSSPLLIVYTIYCLYGSRDPFSRPKLLSLLAMFVLALLLMAPLAAPLVVDQSTSEFPDDVFLDEPQWGRTDLLAYFVPSIHNGLWRGAVERIYQNFLVNQFYTPYLGFSTLLLVAVGLIWRWKKSWFWLLLALLYFILALGPVLAVNGREFPGVPMPYRLVEDFFLLRLLRRPDRLNIFLSLPVAMMAGWGMEAIWGRLHARGARLATGTLVILLILASYSPLPFATTRPEVPEWLSQRAVEGNQYAILDLPVNDRSYDKWYMMYQIAHQKPIATGHVSRLPLEAHDYLDSVPLLKALEERDQMPDATLTNVTEQLQMLHDAGIRYLVIHKKFANEGLQDVWRDWLTMAPAHEDEEVIVYKTDPLFDQDFVFSATLLPQLGLLDARVSPVEAVQSGTIEVDVRWATGSEPPEAYDVCFLLLDGETTAQKNCFPPDPTASTETWSSNEIRRLSYVIPLAEDLPPGVYRVALSLAEPESPTSAGDPARIGDIVVHANAPAQRSHASWENGIDLTGYDLEQSDGRFILTLYWQAQEAVDRSYKVFVHLVDARSGQLIAQSDAIPRDWAYSTDRWEPGEIVREVIILPFSAPSLDDHELRLGLYDERSGERVLMRGRGQGGAQDFLILELPRP